MPILMDSGLRRKRLLNFLRHLIAAQSISPQQVKQFEPVLNEAVESLIALGYGEAQPIFAPAPKKKSWYGTKPYTLKKLQMMALGFADLLIKKKYKGEHAAIRTVAQAFGIKADRLRGWRKSDRLGKTTDPSMKSFREKIAQLDWSEAAVLVELKKTGAEYTQQNALAHKQKAKSPTVLP
jgi:hypothetical protein